MADVLQDLPGWPGTLGIFRPEAESAFSGQAIADPPLRRETGVTILAVIRGGTTLFDPDPGLQLSPGDRLVLLGEAKGLARPAALLAGERVRAKPPGAHSFRVAKIPPAANSPWRAGVWPG